MGHDLDIPRHSMDLDRLASAVDESSVLQRVIELGKKHAGVRTLIFGHPNDLFLSGDDITLPMFPWGTEGDHWDRVRDDKLDFETGPELGDDMMEIQREAATDLIREAQLDPDRALRSAQDLMAYAVLRIIRQNPELKELILADEITYPMLKKNIGDYSDFDLELDLMDDPSVPEHLKNYLEQGQEVMERLTRFTGTEIFRRMEQMLTDPFPAFSCALYGEYIAKLGDPDSDNVASYDEVLELLYHEELIENVRVCWTCPNPDHDPAPTMTFQQPLPPSKIETHTCPRCGDEMLGHTVYYLHEDLRSALMSADGMLAAYVYQILKESGHEPRVSVNLPRGEVDFLLEGPKLIECKVWQGGTASSRTEKALVDQIGRQVADLTGKDSGSYSVLVATNLRDVRKAEELEECLRGETPARVSVDVIGESGFETALQTFAAQSAG